MSHLTIVYLNLSPQHPFYVGKKIYLDFMNEGLKCRDVISKSHCWYLDANLLMHTAWLFFSEDWARWQSVCLEQILTADVHAQKLWRNPKVWMVACLVNGRQGDHVRNVPFAYISCELGGWRQEQLDGLCLMQATFLKNFKLLKNLEVCVLTLPVSIGKHDLASWPNVFFRWMRKVIFLMPLPVSVPYLKNGCFRVS